MHKARLNLNRSYEVSVKEDKLKNLNTTKNRKDVCMAQGLKVEID